MNQPRPCREIPRAQRIAQKTFSAIERFLHIEAVSGIALLVAALVALIWANSPAADTYDALWHTPLSFGIGQWSWSRPLHFWINDVLMTVFFLVVGMEIRREMHDGALSDLRQAALPMVAALGGVAAPALIYLAVAGTPELHHGWAIPTATDIAFAVGVLALLGRSIPSNVRILLLALAIIDDIVAVLIIAIFYTEGLNYAGFLVAGIGIVLTVFLQRIGVGSALPYVVPGAIVWIGLLTSGAHPTLAGVVLGLMTPVVSIPSRESPLDVLARAVRELFDGDDTGKPEPSRVGARLRDIRFAQRELLPPVVRVQGTLHPWVAYGVMPLFALANAGVHLRGGTDADGTTSLAILGVTLGLVLGKPLGVMLASTAAVRLGWCRLPPGVGWDGMLLVGLLAGIGFTMAIFIAMLAFADPAHLDAAKAGVLLGSTVAALLGVVWGLLRFVARKPRSAPC